MTDWNKVGLSAKDMLVGLVTVVAGVQAGSAGAQGAQQLGKGLDNILETQGIKPEAPPKEPPNASRIEPSRVDFQARRDAITATTHRGSAPIFRESVVTPAAVSTNGPPPSGMTQELRAELSQRGFSEAQIAQLEAGTPSARTEQTGAEGIRVAEAQGNPRQSAPADAGGAYEGFPLNQAAGQVIRRTDTEG